MPEFESVRETAEAIGRITCIKTGEEIGLLYQWDNGEMQAALDEDNSNELPTSQSSAVEPDIGATRS
ncbi:hypothetical protein [Celeribacter sp.]|uniref:hypothetical protein n=1 Tax=Celeribacter sp. TaxID=1890673 RepID=UPI003A945D2C